MIDKVKPVDRTILRYKNLVYKVANGLDYPDIETKKDIIQYGWLFLIDTIKNKKVDENFSLVKYILKYMRIYLHRQLAKLTFYYSDIDEYADKLSKGKDEIDIIDRRILYSKIKKQFYTCKYLFNPIHFEILEYYFGFKTLSENKRPTAKNISDHLNLNIGYTQQVIYKATQRLRTIKDFKNNVLCIA